MALRRGPPAESHDDPRMRRPLLSQPNRQDPPSGRAPGPSAGDRWPAGSRAPVYRTPVVTYSLIAANVFMWLLTVLLGRGDRMQQLLNPDVGTLILLGAK